MCSLTPAVVLRLQHFETLRRLHIARSVAQPLGYRFLSQVKLCRCLSTTCCKIASHFTLQPTIMKRRSAKASSDTDEAAHGAVNRKDVHLPAGATSHAEAAQPASASRAPDSARTSAHDTSQPSDQPAAVNDGTAAQDASSQKHKKRRKSSKATAADAPAQQQAAAEQLLDGATAAAAAGDAALGAAAGAVPDGGAAWDPLSPETLQVMLVAVDVSPRERHPGCRHRLVSSGVRSTVAP